MRILLALGTSTGGVGRHVHDLAGGLIARGHEVVVAAPPEVEAQFDYAGLGATSVALELTDRPHPTRDVRTGRVLREAAADCDLVHAHGLRVGALGALALTGASTPLVVTLHNAAPSGRAGRAVHAALEQVVARRADLVLGVSSDLVRRQEQLGARRSALAVVPAATMPRIARDRYAVRHELGLEARTPLLVTIARLAPQKDLDLLLDAVAILRNRHGLELASVVAGEGPLRQRLSARARAEALPVRFLGHRTDVADLLGASDVVVSTARWEGQPVALQEALHLGAAIVATDAGGTADVVGDAALLVPVGDAETLASALADVLRHGAVRDDLRSKAIHRSAELPSLEHSIDAVLTAYASLGVS
ncbi:MAG: glycosyltransferase family 4 protein [Actinobacteria bacterium]|nr:glycosyltransferase family 4 protein [Actinomycetota bacterium]